ncbi:MAG: hypothetical protein H0T62_00810 [Parachlamydiaceae bacterium]|nr:hypothetical protein [Parachlamydiaceae bacterium]
MIQFSNALDRDQLNFLQNNFVVYDPLHQECYTDFSLLEKAQVILIGESHGSSFLIDIQRQFLKIIIGNQSACLLGEGLAPGQSLRAKNLPGWSDVPELDVWGADVRSSWNSIQYLEWKIFNFQANRLELAPRDHVSSIYRQIAKDINDHFLSNEFLRIDNEQNIFFARASAYQKIKTLLKSVPNVLDEMDQEIEEIRILQNKLVNKKNSNVAIPESNRGLLQEIVKSSKEFNRIVGMWGAGHLTCDYELVEGLEKAQISYVMLLPNNILQKKAKDEVNWIQGKTPTMEFTIDNEKAEKILNIPQIFQTYFHPALQKIFLPSKKKPLVIHIRNFIHHYTQGTPIVFSADQKILFKYISSTDFDRLEKLKYEKKIDSCNEEGIEVRQCLASVCNNIFMVLSLKCTFQFKGNFTYYLEYASLRPVLGLKSN